VPEVLVANDAAENALVVAEQDERELAGERDGPAQRLAAPVEVEL
jgi:hypothetical protein